MTKIIALFNLRPGVSRETYEQWARDCDLATVRTLKSVSAFNVYRSTAVLGSDEAPPYQYFEILDIADMTLLGQEAQSEAMTKIVARFQELADNPRLIIVNDIETSEA